MLGGWPVPVLAGIFPLTSYRLALRLHNEVPGIIVPRRAPAGARRGRRRRGRGRDGAREAACSTARAAAATASTSSRPYRKPEPRCSSCSASRLAAHDLGRSRRSASAPCRTSCGGATWSSRCKHLRLAHLVACTFGGRGAGARRRRPPRRATSPQAAPTASPPSESSSRSGGSRRSPPRIVCASTRARSWKTTTPPIAHAEPDERRVARVRLRPRGSAAPSGRRRSRRGRARRARARSR